MLGKDNWEQAESAMQKETAELAIAKAGTKREISGICLPETCWGS